MPETHIPALDPVIRQAYWGKCLVADAPFSRMIPLGHDICPHCGETLPEVEVEEAKEKVEVRAEPMARSLIFYYSSQDTPGEQYPCDLENARHLVKRLKEKGVDIKEVDVTTVDDIFPLYHRAVTGPSVQMRPVFGTKGALEEDFGRSVPALCVFRGDDPYPVEVYPRMGADVVISVEDALERELGPRPEAEMPAEEL